MDLFGSEVTAVFFLIAAGCLCLAQVTDNANELRRCYNTSTDMHCFDLPYNTTNNRTLTASFDNARQRCKDLNSTLIIIKDEETNQLVRQFLDDPSSPIRFQYVWMDAYRINDYNKTYRWQWLDSTLPNMSASDVTSARNLAYYVASLEFGDTSFYLKPQLPHSSNGYVCEYAVSSCSSVNSNSARVFAGRCYIATSEQVSWYEARNRCLKGGGDLASFANVTSIDFTSWLGSDPNVRYWIGLRFARYIWKDSDEEDVKFSKWTYISDDWVSSCLIVCFNCDPIFSWRPKNCNDVDSIYVVCHTVRSLRTVSTTTSTTKGITTSTPVATSTTTTTDKVEKLSLGIGLGVGLGVPLVISGLVIAILAVKNKRLATRPEQKTRNNMNELHTIQELSVDQVNESAKDHYQQLVWCR